MSADVLVVLSMVPSAAEGVLIGRRLVEERLAAAVNVVPGARSIFLWDGRVQESDEALLVAKTQRERYAALERRLLELHSYAVPGVVALPVETGAPAYTAWLRAALAPTGGGEQ